jgi:hypothetical protein
MVYNYTEQTWLSNHSMTIFPFSSRLRSELFLELGGTSHNAGRTQIIRYKYLLNCSDSRPWTLMKVNAALVIQLGWATLVNELPFSPYPKRVYCII